MLSLVAQDSDMVITYFPHIFSRGVGLFYLFLSFVVLFLLISYIALIGLGLLMIAVFLLGVLSKCRVMFMRQEDSWSDKRIKLITDLICGVRTMKAYAWEAIFERKLEDFRLQQLAVGTKLNRVLALQVIIISTVIGPLSSFMLLLVMFLVGAQFDSVLVYFVFGFTLSVQMALFVKYGRGQMLKAVLANYFSRVNSILSLPSKERAIEEDFSRERVRITDAWFKWGIAHKVEGDENNGLLEERGGEAMLKEITLSASDGQIIGVVGEVGGGKTSLLLSIAGETELVSVSLSRPRGC